MSVMRVRPRILAIFRVELFVTNPEGWKPLAIVTKSSISDVAGG